jgi:hypothetical protein
MSSAACSTAENAAGSGERMTIRQPAADHSAVKNVARLDLVPIKRRGRRSLAGLLGALCDSGY